MGIMEELRTDEELKQLKKEWARKKKTDFPLFNHDQYKGMSDYKDKIRKRLEE